MIVTRIWAGLGNQMFQYAAGRAASARAGTSLTLNVSWYDRARSRGTPARDFGLEVFQLASHRLSRHRPIDRLRRRVAEARSVVVHEQQHRFAPDVLTGRRHMVLDGYWQDPRYFADAASLIRTEFTWAQAPYLVDRAILDEAAGTDSVSVHVRRGDYVGDALFDCLPSDYYQRALDLVRQRVSNPRFFVFSDDMSWCRSNLAVEGRVTFVDHNRGSRSANDLRLISGCRHHVIANSSFSWWGAWLGQNDDQVVIAPARWVADDAVDPEVLLPSAWMRI